jgi:hypothetical protein
MRCNICDRTLQPGEIKFNKDHEEFDPCGVCLEVINNVFEDHLEEDEMRVIDSPEEEQVHVE